MSFFDPTKNPAATNQQNPAQGFTAGNTGTDAGKSLSSGFNIASMSGLQKPGGLLASNTFGNAAAAPSFGAAPTAGMQTPGLNLGAPTSTPGLTFGATTTPGTGLNFGTSGGTTAGFGASTFGTGGLTSAAPTSATGGLSFGVPKPATTPAASSFTLGSTAATPASTAPKLTFGMGATTAASTGFSLAGTAPASNAAPTLTGTTSFGLTTAAATTAQTPGIALGAPASTAGFSLTPSSSAQPLSTSFGIGQTTTSTAATTISTGFSTGSTATSATGFNLGTGAAPTLSSGFSLNKTTTTQPAATTATTNIAPQTSLGTVTTVSSASSGQAGTMNFCQLEESINKWTLELEEQEKAFVNQATQVNNWDKLLIANGEKITTLNQEVERVKLEQQHLEHELDYVVGQQKELQDCLVPLEKELASLSVADPERDYTYRLAENLDKQLKQMSQDLKEIIEHLNEANRSQDSSDPIVQIGKILNAHMNSLQWLDQRTNVLSQKIQQIDQMHQNFRQENERSFNLAYN